MRSKCSALYFMLFFHLHIIRAQYIPTWRSLDSRPLPSWYDEAKFGIFIHWGVYSVPGFGSEWFWMYWKQNHPYTAEFMKKNYPSNYTYEDFGRDFTAEFYDPSVWADIFENSGAKYVVITSKHHDGYTLWPSNYSSSWNSVDIGPHRDLLGELELAIRSKADLKFGLYYSLYEWFHPLYVQDSKNGKFTRRFITNKMMPELHELVTKYKPEIIWADGDWEAFDTYWSSREFLAWLYNESPVKHSVIVNDRWGLYDPCRHGGFFTCKDHYNPGVLQPHKWENCLTIDKFSWGYRRNARLWDYRTTYEILKELVQSVSCGGNLLLNVGPSKDGMIPTIMEERLLDIGFWLRVNGEAIYSTKPWSTQEDSQTKDVWYTMSGEKSKTKFVYALVFKWPPNDLLLLAAPKLQKDSSIYMLGVSDPLKWKDEDGKLEVIFPDRTKTWKWIWSLKMSNVADRNITSTL